jgi:ubiquitin carboxyl-terminal hydrolase 12/46
MGAGGSKSKRLEQALGTTFPDSEHFFGLENFGNTCYCNSVLQALYYCAPMRERCLEYSAGRGDPEEDDLLTCLCDLFQSISAQKRRCGVHAPRAFVSKLRHENALFNNHMHQDAHELLNYLLNEMADLLEKRQKARAKQLRVGAAGEARNGGDGSGGGSGAAGEPKRPYHWKTWIHSIFEGVLVNETRCLCCEAVTTRDECFLDLSLEIEQNSSVSACL